MHLETNTVRSTVEDTEIIELFESDVDNAKFLIEIPEVFNRDNNKLSMIKEGVPMKDATSIIEDKSMTPSNETSFIFILSSLLKLPTNDYQHVIKSHYESVLSLLIHIFSEHSRMRSG